MTAYIALVRKDPNSDYGVEFPDFPGCVTAAEDLEEAPRLAEEALRLHIEGLLEDEETLPQPSRLEEIMASAENQDALALLVTLPETSGSVQINLLLPEDTVRKLDDQAKSRGLTRSAFLMKALEDAVRKSA
jgi:predicted RNase H-like HicB family nuclease